MTQEIIKLIEQAVTENTFSLEAVKAISAMKESHEKLDGQVKVLEAEKKMFVDSVAKLTAENNVLKEKENSVIVRENEVAEREKKCIKIEVERQFLENWKAEYYNLFQILFKNPTFKVQTYGTDTMNGNSNNNYQNSTTSINRTAEVVQE